MSKQPFSRRSFLGVAIGGLAFAALQVSCGPSGTTTSSTTPTGASSSSSATPPVPAATTTVPAPAPTTAPASAPAAGPTTAPAQSWAYPSGSVELRISHTWPAERWPEQVQFDKNFQAKHPTYKLDVTNTEFNEYFRKILAQAASHSLPDIMYMQDTRIAQWVHQNSFRALDPYTKADTAFNVNDIVGTARSLVTFKGQMFAIPYDWGGPALVYNKTMFDEAKISYPDDTWTTDKVLEVAKQLTVPGKQWGFDYNYMGNWAMEGMYFTPFGASVFNDDETASTLTDDAAVAAMEFWSGILLKEKAAPTPAEVSAIQTVPFAAGKVALFFAPPWQEPTFNQFGGKNLKWDVAPMPKGPKAQSSSAMGSDYAITVDSKNPDGAWGYLREYMSTEGMTFMWSSRGTGLPTRKSADPPFLKAPTHPPGAKYWVDAISYEKTGRPVGLTADQVIRTMTSEYQKLFLGQASVKDTHASIKKQIDPLLAQNQGLR